ncbi:MAG: helix-turn-helix domain-containing protein [Firmicutes bacterium]|nr:helix-turn-helix domain-containing protein [Candidatus Caballimonas caccae]
MKANEKIQAEFKIFCDDILKKTGIHLSIFSDKGVPFFDDQKEIDFKNISKDIFFDEKNNRTIFTIKIYSKKYFGSIPNVNEEANKNAILIKDLAESGKIKSEDYTVEDFYRAILSNELTYLEANRYLDVFSIPQKDCAVLLLVLEKDRIEDVLGVIKNYIEKDDCSVVISPSSIVIVKFKNASEESQSYKEFSEYLLQTIYEEVGINGKIYIGLTVNKVQELNVSYSQALMAVRISQTLQVKGDVHNYKDYVLYKLLEDLPKFKLNEYLESLLDCFDSNIFEDAEMIETAEEFLDNNLNVSETSRKLYLHRNTLTYRLDKIANETGLDVRKFSDAVTFRLVTMIKKLLK